MMWEAALTALVAGFAPWTLLIVATLLARERPMRHALVFLTAAAVVTLLVGFLVVEAIGSTDLQNQHKHHTVSPAIDLGLGLAILAAVPIFARRSAHHADRPRKPSRFRRHRKQQPASDRPWWERRETGLLAVIALGLFAGSPSPLYLAALHSVTKGRPDTTVGVLEVVLLSALVLFMAEVPIICFALAPERTADLLRRANAWLGAHGRIIVIWATVAVGVYFTVIGLVHLV